MGGDEIGNGLVAIDNGKIMETLRGIFSSLRENRLAVNIKSSPEHHNSIQHPLLNQAPHLRYHIRVILV